MLSAPFWGEKKRNLRLFYHEKPSFSSQKTPKNVKKYQKQRFQKNFLNFSNFFSKTYCIFEKDVL
jgi:hypothetical protein